jgi:two-component system KDP operon response regulator KdpE
MPLSFARTGRIVHAMEAAHAQTILVVDDEEQIRRAVTEVLRPLSMSVLEAETGSAAISIVEVALPDLVVLDLGLPDMPGLDVCMAIRRRSSAPVIVLSARHAEDEKLALFTAGADDYVTKPFSLAEFVARVRAQLRRAWIAPYSLSSVVQCDGLTIDLQRRETSRQGEPIRLTRIEWRLLETLLVHAGRTLTHQQLFDAVWAKAFGHPQQYLRVHVTNLRRKIEREPASPRLIVTEPGVGYRFEREPP